MRPMHGTIAERLTRRSTSAGGLNPLAGNRRFAEQGLRWLSLSGIWARGRVHGLMVSHLLRWKLCGLPVIWAISNAL